MWCILFSRTRHFSHKTNHMYCKWCFFISVITAAFELCLFCLIYLFTPHNDVISAWLFKFVLNYTCIWKNFPLWKSTFYTLVDQRYMYMCCGNTYMALNLECNLSILHILFKISSIDNFQNRHNSTVAFYNDIIYSSAHVYQCHAYGCVYNVSQAWPWQGWFQVCAQLMRDSITL